MSLFGCDHGPLITELRAAIAQRDVDIVAERARYDALLQTVLAMKAAGATVVPVVDSVVEPPPVPVPQSVDELQLLIHDKCGDNTRLRGMMLRQLAVDRAAKVPEEDIRAAIIAGVSSDGVPA